MAKKILIAEDETVLASALESKLTHAGYDVLLVADGEQALSAMKMTAFDLVLLDIMMPKMNGFDVLEKMKSQNMTTPVIVLSNLGQESDVQKAKALGAKDFFVKANTPIAQVVELVEKALKV